MATLDRLEIRPATVAEAVEVHDFMVGRHDPYVRALALGDVVERITNGSLWMLRTMDNEPVGCCYVHVPLSAPGKADPAEFGGVYVVPEFRKRGLGDSLTTLAVALYYAENEPTSPNPPELIAHVHVANDKPRNMLKRAGFVQLETIVVPPEIEKLGFSHMPHDADGAIRGDKFRHDPSTRANIFRVAARLFWQPDLVVKANDTDALTFDEYADALER